ncbi:I78 family peptidase inhibitor [Aureimonas altamirensis]|uniref:I78 family peptidase inhibitor n=1 Tax=Aureimonas altamirensis TaxID=370622 RepID=UPI002556AD65|nr:I78 family peptidase inhibitor [Aureimonas altamirensis]
MTTKRVTALALTLAAASLAACQTGTGAVSDGAAQATCRADAAAALVGMDRLTDNEAMQRTGATIVRQIAPGQGVTMDYRQNRVTVETDPRTGKVVRAACG